MVKSSLLRPTTKQSPPVDDDIIHRGTTFFCWRGPSLFLWCLSQGCKGRSFWCRLYRQPPCHPLAHLLHLNIFGWDAQLQGLARCQILAAPETLLLLDHHSPRHWY